MTPEDTAKVKALYKYNPKTEILTENIQFQV